VTDLAESIPLPHLQPLVVWAVLTGSGFVIVLGTGIVAWWLDRRNRQANRVARRAALASGENAPPLTAEEAAADLTTVREAAARAATVAAHARHDSDVAARVLEDAERAYEAARQARRAATPVVPAQSLGTHDEERDVARAALGAYRRGDLSVEELRQVWYGSSGWDARNDVAEHEVLRLGAEELAARQEYHRALTEAQSARRAEYLADTAARALAAEAMAAAAELGTAWRPPTPRTPGSRGRRLG